MKITKILGCLNETGLHIEKEILDAIEKNICGSKVFLIGENVFRSVIIRPDEMNIPKEATIRNDHKTISFVIWCLPDNEGKCEKLLKDKIIEVATRIMNEANLMFGQLNSLKNEK